MSVVRFPGAGCIVAFMQDNKIHLAWVLEEQAGRLRLLTGQQREVKLSANRLLPWSGPLYAGTYSREAIFELLDKHKQARALAQEHVDAVSLWELAQGEVDKASVQWLAELLWADPEIDAIAAVGQALLECKTHFKLQLPDFEIWPEERVIQRQLEQQAAAERESLASQGNIFFRELWDFHCKRRPSRPVAPDAPLADTLYSLLWQRISAPEDVVGEDALWALVTQSLPNERFLAFYLAIAWGRLPEHYNFWFDRAGYDPSPTWWQAEHGQEVARIIAWVQEQGAVAEQTGHVEEPGFISIDWSDTQDIDDAFHLAWDGEHYTLTVALACPVFGWPFAQDAAANGAEQGALDRAVLSRGSSVYLPEGNTHMLPEVAGVALYSLVAGALRPSLLFTMTITAAGEVTAFAPRFSWIRVTENCCYPDCEQALEQGDASAFAHWQTLSFAVQLAQVLQKKRLLAGAVVTERPEPKIVLEPMYACLQAPEGAITSTTPDVHMGTLPSCPRSELLVGELMILLNAQLPLWAKEQNIPLFYRTQDVVIPKEVSGCWRLPQDIAQAVRFLPPASLDVVPRLHAGLGLQQYSPVSAPLRRYSDFINAAQVFSFLRENTPLWGPQELEKMLPLLCRGQDAVGMVQRFRPRYWKLLFFAQKNAAHTGNGGPWWDAVLVAVNDKFVSVALPEYQLILRGKRSLFGERAQEGQSVVIRLGRVNPLQNEIFVLDAMEA